MDIAAAKKMCALHETFDNKLEYWFHKLWQDLQNGRKCYLYKKAKLVKLWNIV